MKIPPVIIFLSIFYASIFGQANAAGNAAPIITGETFTINSKALGERRRINVYLPPGYTESANARFPVLCMPGGINEDFLHVAGLVQVSVVNRLKIER